MKITRPKEPQGPKIPAAPPSSFDTNRHYWELVCGHMVSLDTDAAYRTQGSPRDKLFCEKCSKWKKPKPKPVREILPSEPLF
jgi:hypothetical protein